jgi:hypothetical protein
MLNLRTSFVLKSYIHLILSLFAVVDPNLNFFLFSLATGINCSGGMHMFGCGSISRPKFGCYSIVSSRLVHSVCPLVLVFFPSVALRHV